MAKSKLVHDTNPLEKESGNTAKLAESTDLGRWRLLDERGRQTWHYMSADKETQSWPQTIADRYHLGLPLVSCRTNYMSSLHTENVRDRTYQTSQELKLLLHRRTTPCHFSPIYSCRQGIGHASTGGHYFSSRAW